MLEKICLRIPRRMASSSSAQGDIERVENLFKRTVLDLEVAVNGFITAMKCKTRVPYDIVEALDDYVKQLESESRFFFGDVDYDLTDYDSCSPGDDPPPAKKLKEDEFSASIQIARKDLDGPAIEAYFNTLEKKIRTFIFRQNEENEFAPDYVKKKFILYEFVRRSKLHHREVVGFIVPRLEQPVEPEQPVEQEHPIERSVA